MQDDDSLDTRDQPGPVTGTEGARFVVDFGVGPSGVGPVMGFDSDDFFPVASDADLDGNRTVSRPVRMTTVSTLASSVHSQAVVPAELLDALVEAVVFSPDPRARSAVIRSIVHEMCAAVRWLHGGDTTFEDAGDVELASISQLVSAAQDHHWRMSFLVAGAVGSDTR